MFFSGELISEDSLDIHTALIYLGIECHLPVPVINSADQPDVLVELLTKPCPKRARDSCQQRSGDVMTVEGLPVIPFNIHTGLQRSEATHVLNNLLATCSGAGAASSSLFGCLLVSEEAQLFVLKDVWKIKRDPEHPQLNRICVWSKHAHDDLMFRWTGDSMTCRCPIATDQNRPLSTTTVRPPGYG